MLHSVASDLGLHCLPMSQLWDARHKRVKSVNEKAIVQQTPDMCVQYVTDCFTAMIQKPQIKRTIYIYCKRQEQQVILNKFIQLTIMAFHDLTQ